MVSLNSQRMEYRHVYICFGNNTTTIFCKPLTHWRRDKMPAILHTFSNAFSWMTTLNFRRKCHWSLFLRVQLTIFPHWVRYWLGAERATNHYLKQYWLVYWRIYASFGLNEVRLCEWNKINPIHFKHIIFSASPMIIKQIISHRTFFAFE